MNREELLAEIRKLVGNKKFTYSDAYIKQINGTPTIGDDGRRYNAITKKYLFIECWGVYGFSDGEYGWKFRRYPIYYSRGSGENIKKVPLEEVFTSDLEKIYDDILFFLWWEKNFHLPKIKAELDECQKYVKMLDKLNIKLNENGEIETM